MTRQTLIYPINICRKSIAATALIAGFIPVCGATGAESLPTAVDAPLVVPIKGKYQVNQSDRKVTMTVDTSSLPWDPEKLKKSEYAAILFNGEATTGRICPHIDAGTRKRSVTASNVREINIETTASEDEIRAVQDAGCVITKRVTYRSIKWVPPTPSD